jgi:hypothetical protein
MKTEAEIIEERMDALYDWAAQTVVNNTIIKAANFNGIEPATSNTTTATYEKHLAVFQT